MAKPLELRPPVNVNEPPASGRIWLVHSSPRCMQSRPPLMDTIDWDRPLSFIVHGDAYLCVGGSWTQLSIGLVNHGNGAAHAPTCGSSEWPCAVTKTWPLWPLFRPSTFRYLALLCRIEFGLASFQSSSFQSKKLLKT